MIKESVETQELSDPSVGRTRTLSVVAFEITTPQAGLGIPIIETDQGLSRIGVEPASFIPRQVFSQSIRYGSMVELPQPLITQADYTSDDPPVVGYISQEILDELTWLGGANQERHPYIFFERDRDIVTVRVRPFERGYEDEELLNAVTPYLFDWEREKTETPKTKSLPRTRLIDRVGRVKLLPRRQKDIGLDLGLMLVGRVPTADMSITLMPIEKPDKETVYVWLGRHILISGLFREWSRAYTTLIDRSLNNGSLTSQEVEGIAYSALNIAPDDQRLKSALTRLVFTKIAILGEEGAHSFFQESLQHMLPADILWEDVRNSAIAYQSIVNYHPTHFRLRQLYGLTMTPAEWEKALSRVSILGLPSSPKPLVVFESPEGRVEYVSARWEAGKIEEARRLRIENQAQRVIAFPPKIFAKL